MGLLSTLGLRPLTATATAGAAPRVPPPRGTSAYRGDPDSGPQAAPPGNPPGPSSDELAFTDARDKLKARLDAAKAIRADATAPLPKPLRERFDKALKAVESAEAAKQWAAATAALPELRAAVDLVHQSATDRDAFIKTYDPHRSDIDAARQPIGEGMPLPGAAKAFSAAFEAVDTRRIARDWAGATKNVPALVTATAQMNKALKDGKAFYTTLDTLSGEYRRAGIAAKTVEDKRGTFGRFALVVENFRQSDDVMRRLVAKGKWPEATRAVADVKDWAGKVLKGQADWDAALAPFKQKFDPLAPRITRADEIADAAPTRMKALEGKALRDRLTAVIDARDAGDFAGATAALPALVTAIDNLVKAQAALEIEQEAFDVEVAKLQKDYETARRIAAGAPPALAKEAAALLAAEKALNAATDDHDPRAGMAAVPAMTAAIAALLAARSKINAAAGAPEFAAFGRRLDALKPRFDKASDAPATKHIDALQKKVRERVAAIQASVAAKDLADAEAGLTQLPADLATMEKARADHAAFVTKFNAARDGDVKRARGFALVPGTLSTIRSNALDEAERRIAALADRGKLADATKAVLAWVDTARAWTKSQPAFENLNGRAPDATQLGELTKLPGGGAVLDALVAALPPDPPQKTMQAAMKARYGISTKRFADRNESESDLSGLQANQPDAPDKSLKRAYEMLGKVPLGNVKGRMTDLIIFDANNPKKRGASFEGTKVYMYCGRAEDSLAPGGPKEQFSFIGHVLPEGEEVDEACQPSTDTPVPKFDFALMHEAGHELDEGISFMSGHMNDAVYGGWQKHSVDEIATLAARHFKYDRGYVVAMLADPSSKPPAATPGKPAGTSADDWKKAHDAVVGWCQSVREYCEIWYQASVSKQVAINGRVYHEAYLDGKRWYSYPYAARSKGFSGYQFRAPGEWFAELHAAYLSQRLKPNHPAMAWLSKLVPPAP